MVSSSVFCTTILLWLGCVYSKSKCLLWVPPTSFPTKYPINEHPERQWTLGVQTLRSELPTRTAWIEFWLQPYLILVGYWGSRSKMSVSLSLSATLNSMKILKKKRIKILGISSCLKNKQRNLYLTQITLAHGAPLSTVSRPSSWGSAW